MSRSLLIIDDHWGFRASARALLEAEEFDGVKEAVDGMEALAATAALRPDVFPLDVQLPGRDGFEVAEDLIGGSRPPVVVLILTWESKAYRSHSARSSARGFLSKSALSEASLAALVG